MTISWQWAVSGEQYLSTRHSVLLSSYSQSDVIRRRFFRGSRPGVIDVIDRAHRRRAEARAETRVFDQRHAGNLRFEGRRVRDEPRMIFVFAAFFAQADDLRGAGLASDVKTRHLDSGGRAGDVNDRPHGVDHQFVLVLRDRKNLWFRAIESSARTCWPIIRARRIVADRSDCAHLF